MARKKDVNKWRSLAIKLRGYQTIGTICKNLRVIRKTAINYIYELRKRGFLRTTRGHGKVRIYDISPLERKEIGYPGLYDIINQYSPLKIAKPYEHRIYRPLSIEEVIIRAIKTQDFRVILSSLYLFKYVKDWKKLLKIAEKESLERQIGALYNLSRNVTRVRKMDEEVEKKIISSAAKKVFILNNVRTKDFPEIENKWSVFIPFRKSDLKRLLK